MRTPIFALIILLFLATATSGTAAERVELRGSVAVAYDGATYTWDPQNFPGFSYDADDNICNERLTLTITGSSLDEPMGVVYETTAQLSDFDFEDWGMYYKISLLERSRSQDTTGVEVRMTSARPPNDTSRAGHC